MKKLLGISLVAVLAATPLMAGASTVTLKGNPAGTIAATTDVATTSYVQGAYNDLAGHINSKADSSDLTAEATTRAEADTALDNRLDTAEAALQVLNGSASTEGSVAKQIADAIDDVDSDVSGLNTRLETAEGKISTIEDSAAMNSGITAAKVQGYDSLKSAVENASTGLAAAHTAIGTINSSDPMNSGITAEKVQSYDALVEASGDYATQDGVVETIKTATATSNATLGVNFGAITTDTSALRVSVPQTVSVNLVKDWDTGTVVPTTLDLGGAAATNVTGTATTSIAASTATGTVNSTITVAEYTEGE